jgi:hypothetical protein
VVLDARMRQPDEGRGVPGAAALKLVEVLN